MPKVAVYNISGQQVGEIELPDELFAAEINESVIHQTIVAQLANMRQGTKSALTRGEVSGGGKKPWRQKGTGRARHGSIRSPIWRTGGVVFAPKPRDFSQDVPKKVKRLALKGALTSKVVDNDIIVLDELNLSAPKTKEMVGVLKNLNIADKKSLIVLDAKNETVQRASRNISGVKTMSADMLNVYDILAHDKFIIT
ncbi:MAG TPA: 50S ribosomal protein L4, partial [Clostridia bacterium]|nr:50S ribosomal protein L4 [Clostridia bacterium]